MRVAPLGKRPPSAVQECGSLVAKSLHGTLKEMFSALCVRAKNGLTNATTLACRNTLPPYAYSGKRSVCSYKLDRDLVVRRVCGREPRSLGRLVPAGGAPGEVDVAWNARAA